MNCRTAGEVLELAGSGSDLPARHAAAVLSTLARLLRAAPPDQRQAAAAHAALPALYRALQHGAGELRIRDLSAVLQQCVWLGLRPPKLLLSEVTEQLILRLPAVAPAEACHAAWALTKLGHPGISSLLTAIDAQVQQQQRESHQQQSQQRNQIQQQKSQQQQSQQQQQQSEDGQPPPPWLAMLAPSSLINLLWACGKAAFRSQPLLRAITQALLLGRQPVARSGPGGMGGTCSFVARSAQPAPLAALNVQQLSMLFYSLGMLQWAPSQQVGVLPGGQHGCLSCVVC
jgi:hypothetical protein